MVTTDAAGNVATQVVIPGAAAGSAITATATAPDGSTSEFSSCVEAVAAEGDVSCRACSAEQSPFLARIQHR